MNVLNAKNETCKFLNPSKYLIMSHRNDIVNNNVYQEFEIVKNAKVVGNYQIVKRDHVKFEHSQKMYMMKIPKNVLLAYANLTFLCLNTKIKLS